MKILIFLLISSFSYGAQWQQVSDFSGAGRHRATGMSIGNKGYIGLGHINGTGIETYYSDWWEYDPSSNSWTQRADYIGNNGLGDLDVVGIEINEIGYLTGGLLDPFSFYSYNPTTNSWTQEAIMPSPFMGGQPVAYGDNGLFFEGNYDSLYLFNSQTNTWSTPPALQVPTNGNWYPAFDINEKLYFFNFQPGFITELWELDPVLETWQYLNNDFPDTVWFYSSCQHHNNGLLINSDGVNDNKVFSYDPITNSWSQLEDFPGSKRYLEVSFDIDGHSYFGTGTNGINYSDFWRLKEYSTLDEDNSPSLKVYPNPSVNNVVFDFGRNMNSEIKIFSPSGQLIRSEKIAGSEYHFIRESLSNGQYFYEVTTEDTSFTGKFILN
ncbi:MAG: T9SS type A sorting domain-containing protein [Crocinitomicaceae bacterium]|nr:T9SS type A sorting domain-containing protein [Crocinitomicaceae bacterium]